MIAPTKLRWLLVGFAVASLAVALGIWMNRPPCHDPSRTALSRAIEHRNKGRADLTRYWATLDLASVEALERAGPTGPEGLEKRIRELPRPDGVRLELLDLRLDRSTNGVHDGATVKETAGAQDLVLIASSDSERRDDGAHVALFTRRFGPWQLYGSTTIPAGWQLRTIWIDGLRENLAIEWDYQGGTQVWSTYVALIDLETGWRSPTFEFIDGVVKPTARGLVVEHRAPGRTEGDGSRENPHFIQTQGLNWARDLPNVFSLVQFEDPKQVFPSSN
jgi:hypothetical protein